MWKFLLLPACLAHLPDPSCPFPSEVHLGRRHNLTFQKGQLPASKGLNIDSGWWLTDISFAQEGPEWGTLARTASDSRQAVINPGLLCTELSCRGPRHLLQPSLLWSWLRGLAKEHFTSWIYRWQTQLNPQPRQTAAWAWRSRCGSRWCPPGALQRQAETRGGGAGKEGGWATLSGTQVAGDVHSFVFL